MIESSYKKISIKHQCELLKLSRSSYYNYRSRIDKPLNNFELRKEIELLYINYPSHGSRRIRDQLRLAGWKVNRKLIQRLMREMNIYGKSPGPNTSKPSKHHKIYPYLLRKLKINRPDQVWCTDITYIPLPRGFIYLAAIIDVYSKRIIDWQLSNTLDSEFCVNMLENAFKKGKPEIFNTDQGAQFTSKCFTDVLKKNNVKISMDGKGRALDNVWIERFWRTVKYDHIYFEDYETVPSLHNGLRIFMNFYNYSRPHSTLGGKPPELFYQNWLKENKREEKLVS